MAITQKELQRLVTETTTGGGNVMANTMAQDRFQSIADRARAAGATEQQIANAYNRVGNIKSNTYVAPEQMAKMGLNPDGSSMTVAPQRVTASRVATQSPMGRTGTAVAGMRAFDVRGKDGKTYNLFVDSSGVTRFGDGRQLTATELENVGGVPTRTSTTVSNQKAPTVSETINTTTATEVPVTTSAEEVQTTTTSDPNTTMVWSNVQGTWLEKDKAVMTDRGRTVPSRARQNPDGSYTYVPLTAGETVPIVMREAGTVVGQTIKAGPKAMKGIFDRADRKVTPNIASFFVGLKEGLFIK